jgi:hypothetical protein
MAKKKKHGCRGSVFLVEDKLLKLRFYGPAPSEAKTGNTYTATMT